MPKISLATYSISVRKRQKTEYLSWQKFDGVNDLSDILAGYIKRWQNYNSNSDTKQVINLKSYTLEGEKHFGIIETGEWGYESTLVDIKQKAIAHKRNTNEAEMIPFFFFMGFPNDKKEGVLILERFGTLGIRSYLGSFLDSEFQKKHSDYIVEFTPLIMEEVAKEYLDKGRILRISFISHDVPSDICDALERGSKENIAYSEYVIHAKKRSKLPLNGKIKEMLKAKSQQRTVFSMRSFEFDSIKVKIEKDGVVRTLDVVEFEKIRSYINIDDKIKKEKSGHPEIESIKNEANNLYYELIRRMPL